MASKKSAGQKSTGQKSTGQKSTGQKSSGVIAEKKEITKLKAEIQRLNEELEKAKAGSGQSPEFMHMISSDANKQTKKQIKELTAEVEQLKSETENMADLKKEIKALTERNQELHDALSQKDHELTKQRNQSNKSSGGSGEDDPDREKLENDMNEIQSENKTLKAENAAIKKHKEIIEQLQKENASLLKDIEKKKQEVQQLQKQEREREKLENDMNELQSENKTLKAENPAIKKHKEIIEQLQKENASLLKDITGKEKEDRKRENTSSAETISKLKNEVDGLRNRLSQIVGAQLVDSNPTIADLSDPNRPLSLGEKFSELYDNEWTDAMEEISDIGPNEEDVIRQLLDIVSDAYKFCHDRSDQFMKKINGTLRDFSSELVSEKMPKEIAKTNKDFRKSLAVHVVSYLQQEFTKTETRQNAGQKTKAYMNRCVLVCWFMTVQDPKVVIKMDAPAIFDEDRYKPYTKKGKRLDYLVWPALYLHEGGPLISKGVAQGKP